MSYQSDHLAWQQRVMHQINSASKPQVFKPDGTYNFGQQMLKPEDEFTRTFHQSHGLRRTGALPKPGRNYSNDFGQSPHHHPAYLATTSGPFSPQNSALKQRMLKTPKREQYVGSASKTMSRMSLDQFQQKKMSGAASVSSVSRYGLKKGRFNEDFSQHHVAQRTGSSVSGMHQNKLSKITKSISKHQGQNNLSLMQPQHSLSQNPSRNVHKRFPTHLDENKSEKADSIKSKIIDAISKMDEAQIQKLRNVLRIQDQQDNEVTEENLKKLDEINKQEEDSTELPHGGIEGIIPAAAEMVDNNQIQHAQGAQMEVLPSIPPSDKSLSNLKGNHRAPSIRSKHPLSIRSGISTRVQPSYISNLEIQLNEERKAREKLQYELQELKKISREISQRVKK